MPNVAAKRKKDNITLGSGHVYLTSYTDTIPGSLNAIRSYCIADNLLGHIKGGATLEYSEETTEEKDDFGIVRKVITTDETAVLKMGLITWNGETLQKLIDRCKITEQDGVRITQIGGVGNTQGGYYVVIFHHEDKKDGDLWVVIVGRNTAGATLSFAPDSGTLVEPEFTAIPQDEDGTLIQLFEEIGTGTAT